MKPDRCHRTMQGRCSACGKQVFTSRKKARKAAKDTHPGEAMSAYECRDLPPGSGVWHFGHNIAWRIPPREVETPSCPEKARAAMAAMAAAARRTAAS